MWMKNPDPRIKPPFGSIVDWSHPLADGLVCCLLLNEYDGKISDLVDGSLPSDQNAIWRANSLRFDNAQYASFRYKERYHVDDELTIIARARFDDNTDGTLGCMHSAGNKYRPAYGIVVYYDDGSIRFGLRTSDGSNYDQFNIVSPSTSYVTYCGVWKSGQFCRGYADGKLKNEDTSTAPVAPLDINDSCRFSLGGYAEGSSLPSNRFLLGNIEYHFTFNTAKSNDIIQWLYAEPYWFILWPSYTTIFDLAPAGVSVQRDAVIPAAWKRYILKDGSLNLDARKGLLKERIAPVSFLTPSSRLFSIPVSMLRGVSKQGDILVEALEGLEEAKALPVDWFSTTMVASGKEIPVEAVRFVLQQRMIPAEGLLFTNRQLGLSYSWLISVDRDVIVQTDWQGALLVTKDAILPVDFTRLLYGEKPAQLDWTEPVLSEKEAAIELLSFSGADSGLEIEALKGIEKDIEAGIYWVKKLLSQKELGPSWLVFRQKGQDLALEWLIPVEDEFSQDVSWLKGVAASSRLPVEVAGKAIRVELLRFRLKEPSLMARFKRIKETIN